VNLLQHLRLKEVSGKAWGNTGGRGKVTEKSRAFGPVMATDCRGKAGAVEILVAGLFTKGHGMAPRRGGMGSHYRHPALKQLKEQQARFAPRERRLEQIDRAEQLLGEIDAGRRYPV
jgi:hypothetical protein